MTDKTMKMRQIRQVQMHRSDLPHFLSDIKKRFYGMPIIVYSAELLRTGKKGGKPFGLAEHRDTLRIPWQAEYILVKNVSFFRRKGDMKPCPFVQNGSP